MRTNQNFSLPRGDSLTLEIELEPGAPDLTGGTARWRLASSIAQDAQVFVTKTTGQNGGMALVFDTTKEVYRLVIVMISNDTEAIPPGDYYHEAEVTEANGKTHTVSSGVCKIKATLPNA